jgi:hypothetical protein
VKTRLRRLANWEQCVRELRNKARYYEKSGLIPTLDACATVVKSDKLVSPELLDELSKGFDKLKANQGPSPDWHPNSNDILPCTRSSTAEAEFSTKKSLESTMPLANGPGRVKSLQKPTISQATQITILMVLVVALSRPTFGLIHTNGSPQMSLSKTMAV